MPEPEIPEPAVPELARPQPQRSAAAESGGSGEGAPEPGAPEPGAPSLAVPEAGPGAPGAGTPGVAGPEPGPAGPASQEEPVSPPVEAAGELVRMGVEPGALGLDEPSTMALPTLEPPPATQPATGQAGPHAVPPFAGHSAPDPAAGAQPTPAPEPTGPEAGVSGATHPGRHPGTTLNRPLTSAPVNPGGPAPATSATRTEIAQRLFPEEFGLVVPAGWRRLVRAVTFGVCAPGAAAAVEWERSLVSRVRARQSDPRTVTFVAGKGGVGTTTTAIGVGHTLAALRTDQTVLVDGRTGTASLGERVSEMRAPTTSDLADGTDRRAPLSFRSRLHLVDSPPWHAAADPSRLGALLTRLRDSYQFTTVDIGNDTGPCGEAALNRADQVVIVTSTRRDAVEATRVVLGRIQQGDPSRLGTVVVAVVGVVARGGQRTCRALREEFGLEPTRLLLVPHDPGLVDGDRFDPDRLRTTTREAYLKLAALLTDPSPLTGPPAPAGAHQRFAPPARGTASVAPVPPGGTAPAPPAPSGATATVPASSPAP